MRLRRSVGKSAQSRTSKPACPAEITWAPIRCGVVAWRCAWPSPSMHSVPHSKQFFMQLKLLSL